MELIYVADPMCSWCWGFSPVVERLASTTPLPLRVVVGGLRPADRALPLDGLLRSFLLREWAKVASRTGQPFDPRALERDGWVYDTMVADTAVVTMRHLAPQATLPFLSRVQRAFYAEGIDVTDPAAYAALVDPFPVDPGGFVSALASDEMRQATRDDFDEARRLGAAGFPTLLLREERWTRPVAVGYVGYEELAGRLEDLDPDAGVQACGPDGPC